MPNYNPPMNEISFLLDDVLHAHERTKDIPQYKEIDQETVKMILDMASTYATKTAFPINGIGDKEGCTYNAADGSVKTPKGFKEAYDEFRYAGMVGLEGSAQFGGSGMPHYAAGPSSEIIVSTNMAHAMYGGLTGALAKVLERYATDEIKNEYLPRLYAGDWTGTMCLTEPDAGSDLARVRSTAKPNEDGSYAISGQKIFISGGEHDMTDNIVHLVLARLPGAPEGTKGISLFLVPKNDTKTNEANGVKCIGIEHKMGINGSATCSMSFDGSKGFLIGNPNEGLKAMFTMMNDARLKVGIQGLGLSEVAYQNAAEYAAIRVQGRKITESFNKAAKAVTLENHANIKRELDEMKAQIDGFRALAYEATINLDLAERHPDEKVRAQAEEYVSLLTPILKANGTDMSCAITQKAIQIHGGMGYIGETGVEQYYRDALIGTIYEGTNDIQAMDFTFAKALNPKRSNKPKPEGAAKKQKSAGIPTKGLKGMFMKTALGKRIIRKKVAAKLSPAKPGTPLSVFGLPFMDELKAVSKNSALSCHAAALEGAFKTFTTSVENLGITAANGQVEDILVHSRDFTDMFGKLAVGRMWLKVMAAAQEKMAKDPASKEFCEEKMRLGGIYINRILRPQMESLRLRMTSAGVNAILQRKVQAAV